MSVNKKYELLENDTVKSHDGRTLKRIRALVAIEAIGVRAGDLGGYIESEKNLSKIGKAWVFDKAQVFGDACVYDDALVQDAARIFGYAQVFGRARIYGNACIFDDARVYGKSQVYGNSRVYGTTQVYDDAYVYGGAQVFGDAQVYGYARICDISMVFGSAQVREYACVYGDVRIYGDACIGGNARIELQTHLGWFNIVGPENGTLTWFRTKKGIVVNHGDFSGSLKEFLKFVSSTYSDNQIVREYRSLIRFIRLRSANFTYEEGA